jgi:2-polyprenyl-6-methoxyphenol hydroxylase-like FAD-dependent oxidoreductase
MIAGVLFDNMRIPEDTSTLHLNPQNSCGAYLFPQGKGRVRCYCACPVADGVRLQGDKDIPKFIEISIKAGVSPQVFEGAMPVGPLASFDAADIWVEHPYGGGVALIGDAAASSDPSWGQGLSLTFRDVRTLRDCLLQCGDWESAGEEYARCHDNHYTTIHEVTSALKDVFMRSGPEWEELRERVLPAIGENPQLVPDHIVSGPDLPWNNDVREVFLCGVAA